MEIKKTINNGTTRIAVVENIVYEKENVEKYKKDFQNLKSSGFVFAQDFDSSTWYIKDEIDGLAYLFTFDLEIHKELNTALKGFVVLRKLSGTSSSYLKTQIMHLKKIIFNSKGLKLVEGFESYLFSKSQVSTTVAALAMKAFINFHPFYGSGIFLEKCKLIEPFANSNRYLPPFEDVFEFNEIINQYSKTENDMKTRMMFYIVELWWYITNIIPMRPNEFLRFRKKCLEYKADGTVWIEVPRSKSESEAPEKEIWYQWIQINLDLYKFIKEYLIRLDNLKIRSEYLIPVELHEKYRKPNGRKRKHNNKMLSTLQLNDWINRFYKEIIEQRQQEFGLSIIKLTFRMLDLSNNLFLKLVPIQEHSFLFKQFG